MGSGAVPPDARLPAIAAFCHAVGTTFRVPAGRDNSTEVALVRVDDTDRSSGRETFSLLFAGPVDPFPQGTYVVGPHALGSFPLFLVQVASDAGGQRYEAVFNRPTP